MRRKHLFQYFLLGMVLLFQSCEVDIMNDKRVLVTGTIVNSDNNPIPNISVRSQTTRNAILGEAISDENGQFEFTSLMSKPPYNFYIAVNSKPFGEIWYYHYDTELIENIDYSAKAFYDETSNRNATTYNLGVIQLNKYAKLNLHINNIPGDTNTLEFKLDYDSAICRVDLNGNDFNQCEDEDFEFRFLDSEYSDIYMNVESQLGSTVDFIYKLNGEPEQSISIPLTNPENTYVFEY
ncbi:carboxypeptidase-like regulatory domain-containing protein [Aequorivita xiaoshiensis]|uniref:Carboxypeptidase-like regulatory domain-containing protein n=1 Tax=Aequorivita xiaoshiensis TaxID=2874476 RepID=A0A9X1R4C1_9FLAO|nr:carboxypeptidase-like regulatory domain-containing protein [Aequorivita xiaoshiensis]MCG2431318.1 carboxypeptidase-like regulatory domain-containing protein [Aequorivita xiaoshiensis]